MPSRRPVLRSMLLTGWFICGALALAACSADRPMSTLDPHGTHAQNILDLLVPIFWAAVAVFVVVEGILVYSVFRFRSRPNDGIPTQIHGNTTIEILWTIAPALIVLVIAVLTFRTQAINSRIDPTSLKIHAIGQQWWFAFEYPEQGVVTANEMYIPVGRDVTVQLDGADVLHNFWVPKLAGKTYMIPGNTNYLSFKATEEGLYRGQCAEFCGEEHALMRFRVIAVQPDVFDKWIAAHRADPAQPATTPSQPVAQPAAEFDKYVPEMPVGFPTDLSGGNPANGYQVFTKKACVTCHVIAGNPKAVGKIGPNLSYLGSRTTLAAGVLPNTPYFLSAWLYDPGTIKPGNKMASVVRAGYLSAQEIKDLVAYLDGQRIDIALPAPR